MTTYEVIRKEKESLIEVKGHAGFGPHGEDIVCSAISTACIMTANLIDKMKEMGIFEDLPDSNQLSLF